MTQTASPNESNARIDLEQEYGELLQELRVLLPAVQILFAFLLTVPFSRGFPSLNRAEKDLFMVTLIGSAVAVALLIAPGAFHRILFRHHDKEWLIRASNRLAILATVFLAISMTCAIHLVTDVVLGSVAAGVAGSGVALLFICVWYVVPLSRRASIDRRRSRDAAGR